MKILVTGADGFIGSHLTESLVRQGHNVKAFVQYNSNNSWGWLDYSEKSIKKNLEIFSGDIRDPYGVRKAVKSSDIVIHLAALIAIPYSYHSPDSYVDTNIKGTLNILQAVKDYGVSKLIHTSTSEVYGTAHYVPIDEKHPLQGQSPYSATKISADHLAESFYRSFETPLITIRPFNTYGPRQSARAVIPTIISQIVRGKKEIKLGSIEPTRDFSYIQDTVDGFISTLNHSCFGEVINLGSNFEISIKDTVKLIAEVMNSDVKIIEDNKRLRPPKSEVDRLWADNTKAKKLLNWSPVYYGKEGMKRGIEETVAWFKKHNNKFIKDDIYNI
jgi:dTDP-glucose 4,6-dehydratase